MATEKSIELSKVIALKAQLALKEIKDKRKIGKDYGDLDVNNLLESNTRFGSPRDAKKTKEHWKECNDEDIPAHIM